MGIIKWVKEGSWHIESNFDKRWNKSGRGYIGFGCCPEAEEAVEELKKKYGDPPEDLKMSYWKD